MMQQYDVFISYATRDYMYDNGRIIPGNVISRIQQTLRDNGISYWIDKEGLLCGDEFPKTIAEQIRNAQVFLFVSSQNSNKSDWTLNEIATARNYGKRIIPFRYDDTPYDTSIMIYLAGLQYVNYEDNPDKAMKDLVVAVQRELGMPPRVNHQQPISLWITITLWCQRHWVILFYVISLILALSLGGVYYNIYRQNTKIHLVKDPVVYVTQKGLCYHIDPKCPHIKNRSKSSTTIVEAEQYGKRPCEACCKKKN